MKTHYNLQSRGSNDIDIENIANYITLNPRKFDSCDSQNESTKMFRILAKNNCLT